MFYMRSKKERISTVADYDAFDEVFDVFDEYFNRPYFSRTSALYEENMTAVQLKSYSELKKQLGGYGISIDDDIPKFAKVVHGISQKDYDVGKVIKEFSDFESTRKDYLSLKALIPGLERKYNDLNQDCSILEEHVKSDDDLNKSFARLSRAATTITTTIAVGQEKEEAVSISELKLDVAKALRVLIAKLNPNNPQDN